MMYDGMSYEDILQRMLDRVPDGYDKREGSVIYTALAPAAAEFQLMCLELGYLQAESFADTCSREALVRRAKERGIIPKEAKKALRRGTFNTDVPIGSRFSLGELNYIVVERVAEGVFTLECETPGEAGNRDSGALVPITYLEGLRTAALGEVLLPGEEEEDTESLRRRYYAGFDSQAFGGNRADYKEKVKALDGVGGVKIERAWNGGGTVKLTVIASDYSAPSALLVQKVQDAVDPTTNQGEGLGLAPIDHVVTVEGVKYQDVELSARFTFQEGWDMAASLPGLEQAVDVYFRELAAAWEDSEGLIVRISQLEAKMLNAAGVLDVSDTTLNGAAQNLPVSVGYIPRRGGIVHAASA